jgi:hypothetical protein
MRAARRHVVHISFNNLLRPDTTIGLISPESFSMRLAENGTYRPDDHECQIIAVCQLPGHPTPKSFTPVAPAPASLSGPKQPYRRLEEGFRGKFIC